MRWLHELNFNQRVPQPCPERQNEEARRVFRLELQAWCADPKVELWFGDESGIEGDRAPAADGCNRASRAPCLI